MGGVRPSSDVIVGNGNVCDVGVYQFKNYFRLHSSNSVHNDGSELAGVHVLLGGVSQRNIAGKYGNGEYTIFFW